MKLQRQNGFSLIELMIAILLAAITAIVVLNVLNSYQTRSNTMTGRNDAQVGAAVSLYTLEKDIRMGGAGLVTPRGPLCSLGVNIAWNGTAITNGQPLLPVRIIDGGTGPDSIEIIRSDSDFGAAPTRLLVAMAGPTSLLDVDGKAGLQNGNLIMVGPSDGTKLCTLLQLTAAPAVNGSGWQLTAGAGTSNFNPATPASVFTSAVSYSVRDIVVNMGNLGVRRYGIICGGGGVPSATNNCDLASWDPLSNPTPNLTTATSISPQIVELQAQYGIAPANSSNVDQWVDATGSWAAPSLTDQPRIKALRISIVARGSREADQVTPASVTLWQDDPLDPSTARVRSFSTAERRFRFQALTVVVPLVNAIWAGT